MFDTLRQLAAHEVLRNITAVQLSRLFGLIACLKRDIAVPQPLTEAADCPPTFMPVAISEFLAESLEIPLEFIQDLWEIVRKEAWDSPHRDEPDKDDEECFRRFGWKRELSGIHVLFRDICV